MRGKAEKTETPRPLHRLTGLRDDPAAGWLSPAGMRRLSLSGLMLWAAYVVGLGVPGILLPALVLGPLFFGNYFVFGTLFAGVLLFPTARRVIVRLQNARLQTMVAEKVAEDVAKPDDWAALEADLDDQPISIVGWARGKLAMPTPVGGQPAIGIALECVQSYRGVLESVHDFDLVDEHRRSISILVAGGRLLGQPNVRVFSDDEGRMLVASLDLPAGATPTGDAIVIRDGDPLMVVGFRSTIVDPTLHGVRNPPVRLVVRSAPRQPLLIYPIAAERQPVPDPGPG